MGALFTLLLSLIPGLILIGGVFVVRVYDQRERDKNRTTYILNFPEGLDQERVLAWLRAISRTLKPSKFNLTAPQTIVFEMWATDQGITHRLKVPWQKEDDIIPQLRALAPGVSATPDKERPDMDWKHAVEIGETNKSRPLSIPSPKDTAASILASAQPLKEGEAILVQWVIAPAGYQPLPHKDSKSDEFRLSKMLNSNVSADEINERRAKLAEPNVMGVLRVAAAANTPVRAAHLVDRIRTSYASTSTPHNQWYKRAGRQRDIVDRVKRAASLTVWPAQLSATELTALIAWPIGSPNVSGLPRGASRQLPANMSVPSEGIVIGHSTFPGNERKIAISQIGGFQHTHIIGGTGSGKTTLLANMAEQDMLAGHTVIVMESKGDLFYEALARVPWERRHDVIVIDVQDTAFPVGFNILQQGNPRVAASNIKNLFEHHFPDLKRSVWARAALHRGLQTLVTDPNAAFVDIGPLFSPSSRTDAETGWKEHLIRNIPSSEIDLQNYWQRFSNKRREDQEREAQPLMDRAWIINETPEVRNIFGQSKSSFTFEEVFSDNKIVLINLAGIPDDAASLTGTFFMQSMWTAIQKLKGSAEPAYLYLDEFQSFLKLPISTEEMMTKSRSFGLGMRLGHQHLDQLKVTPELGSAVMNNARNKVNFALGSGDASIMAREFGNLVSPHDFQMLRQYEAIARVVTDEGISQPLSLRTLPPTRASANINEIRRLSREKYGRPVAEVISDMRERRKAPESSSVPMKRNRPKISGSDW